MMTNELADLTTLFLSKLREQLIEDDVLHWKREYRLDIVRQIDDLLKDINASEGE